MELAAPTVLLNKYRVEYAIGQGGMGNVYAATHLSMNRQVAIKVLRPELSGERDIVERFGREVVATARINNPYVVSVYDVDRLADGTLFIVMDLLQGETLRDRMERGPVPREECVDIIVEAAAALVAAHQAGVVHRDLKPENMFLSMASIPQVKVVDFGIAKLEDARTITITNALLGTPAYMAPEQLLSLRNTSPRSDLWSLGVVAFELLAGRPPFHADSMPGLCAAILTGDPPTPEDLPELDENLRLAVLRCLERNPQRRYQSAGAFARAIAHYGSARAQRALACIDSSMALSGDEAVEATLPIRIGPSHADAAVQAQPSVHAPPIPSRRRQLAWFSVGAMLALAFGIWGLQLAAPRHTVLGAAAASLSWFGEESEPHQPERAHAGRVHEPSLRFRAESPDTAIHMLSFSIDRKLITTFSAESGRVRVWNPESRTELRTLPAGNVERAYFGASSYALTKTSQGVLTQWSLMSGVSVGSEKLESAIAFAGSLDLGVVVVTADRQVLTFSELGHRSDSMDLPLEPSGVLAVRSDRRKAVIGTLSSAFLFVDLAREQVTKLQSPSESALSAALFLSQRGVITGDNAGRSMVWQPPASEPVHELPRLNGPVLAISASSDAKQVLIAGPHQLMLYDPETRVTRTLSPAGAAMSTARLSVDGSQVAVGNKQGEILVFPTSAFD
ncbi:MAG: WD40 repeat domain-containing serine/threonine protein kinase [Myxococcales bacterium]